MNDWVLPGRFGAERWRDAGGRLALVVAGGTAADLSLLDRAGARDTVCGHSGPLPNAFRYCPECGAPLRDAPEPDRSAPWSPPFGAANGLPALDGIGRPVIGSPVENAVPPSGAIGLAVAGTPSRLLCCDRNSGWVSAWSDRDERWHRLAQVPPCPALPRSVWSAAATATGLALPTERGPVRLDLTDLAGAASIAPVDACASVGGTTRLGETLLGPVERDGALALAAFAGGRWTMLPVTGAAPAEIFASPVVASDTAFWCGRTGFLSVRDTAAGLQARFAVWSDGVVPLSDARPVVGRDGTLHLPCRLDDNTLVYETLPVPAQPRGRRIARGYAPGTGTAVFRENTRARLPWDERPACDYPLGDDRFLYPLLDLGEDRFVLAVCSPRDRLGAFLGDPLFPAAPDDAPVACALHYSRGPRMLQPLDCVLRAQRASDLGVAVHGGALWCWSALDARCFRWALRDAG